MKLRSALVVIAVGLFSWLSRFGMTDDGLIYARVLRNALAGHGLVFNLREPVNALTSPLFTYLVLALAAVCHGDTLLAEHLAFALFLIAACLLAETFFPWAGVAVGTTAYFYILIGLESTLFLFMIMLTLRAYVDRRDRWVPVLAILTTLTRFEGGLLIPILAWHLWRQRRVPPLLAFLPPAAIAAAWLLLNHHWYGAFLPNSASSKIGQGRSGYWGPWPTAFLRVRGWAFRGPGGVFHWTLYIVPLVAYFAFLGWRKLRPHPINDLVAPFWLGLALFYVLFNIPGYHWYWAPLIFFPILYAVGGLPPTRLANIALLAVIALAAVTNAVLLPRISRPAQNYLEIARWLDNNAPPAASVETAELGTIGWYTRHRVIDILGLTEPKNAVHIAHRDLSSWIAEDHPDYIVVHKPLWIFEQATAAHPEYRELPFHSGPIYLLGRVNAPPPQPPPPPNAGR